MAKDDKKVKGKENIEKTNKIIKGVVLLIALLIVFVVIYLFSSGYFNKERKLTNSITNLGTNFYEDFYYKKISESGSDSQKFLEQFGDVGIIVSLYNMEKNIGNDNESDIKVLNDAKCDKYKTTVTIYPKSPYKKDSYTMKANLECNLK